MAPDEILLSSNQRHCHHRSGCGVHIHCLARAVFPLVSAGAVYRDAVRYPFHPDDGGEREGRSVKRLAQVGIAWHDLGVVHGEAERRQTESVSLY